jgi:hypothetical protein
MDLSSAKKKYRTPSATPEPLSAPGPIQKVRMPRRIGAGPLFHAGCRPTKSTDFTRTCSRFLENSKSVRGDSMGVRFPPSWHHLTYLFALCCRGGKCRRRIPSGTNAAHCISSLFSILYVFEVWFADSHLYIDGPAYARLRSAHG